MAVPRALGFAGVGYTSLAYRKLPSARSDNFIGHIRIFIRRITFFLLKSLDVDLYVISCYKINVVLKYL